MSNSGRVKLKQKTGKLVLVSAELMQPHSASPDVSDKHFIFFLHRCSNMNMQQIFRGHLFSRGKRNGIFLHCVCHHVAISSGSPSDCTWWIISSCKYVSICIFILLLWIKSPYWSSTDTREALSSKSTLPSLTRHNIDRSSIFYILHVLTKQYRFSDSQS